MSTLKIRMWALVTGMVTIFISSIIVGVLGQFVYWLLFDSFGRSQQRNDRKLKLTNKQKHDEYYTIIIGTGFSGLGMAIRLNKLGMKNYILLERHDEVGGTWYANTYPGCACDVPSTLYSFSFEPNPNWSHYFARREEIGAYLKFCSEKYNLRSSIRFNTNVTELRWLEDRQLWQVKAQSREGPCTFYGRSIVLGTGPLSNASYPDDIAGLENFQGKMCHTAAWDKTIDFKNKRVAIVGTGASAIQAVPEIHQMDVSKLYVFQRTAPWIVPRVDRPLDERGKAIFRRFPLLQKLVRLLIYWATESFALSFVYRWPLRLIMQNLVRCNLEIEVPNEKLRKLVTPKWEFGCKRMLLTTNWYSTLQKSNVQLVTSPIQQLTSNSIRTQTGDELPVDIIIWSTGFQTQTFPIAVYGIDQQSLADRWSDSIQAYRGVTVPGFPNFFLLLGPNTTLGHNSVVLMIESQINYIAEAFLYMDKHNLSSITVKETVHEEFNRNLQLKLKNTVWQKGGCKSWYQDSKGNNTSLWPGFTWSYILLMNTFDHQNYSLSK